MKSGLLVASPQLSDPFFGRTVILLCDYSAEGAMGVVINRPLGATLQDVLGQLEISASRPMLHPVLWGGPVLPEVGFLAYGNRQGLELEGQSVVGDRLVISASRTVLELAAIDASVTPYFLCLGHAGWGPGQLDAEIQRGTWVVLEFDDEIVFETPLEERWERSMARLGVDPEHVFMHQAVDE